MPHERDPLWPEQSATRERWIAEGPSWPDGADQGRDFRLTDVHGNVVHDVLA